MEHPNDYAQGGVTLYDTSETFNCFMAGKKVNKIKYLGACVTSDVTVAADSSKRGGMPKPSQPVQQPQQRARTASQGGLIRA